MIENEYGIDKPEKTVSLASSSDLSATICMFIIVLTPIAGAHSADRGSTLRNDGNGNSRFEDDSLKFKTNRDMISPLSQVELLLGFNAGMGSIDQLGFDSLELKASGSTLAFNVYVGLHLGPVGLIVRTDYFGMTHIQERNDGNRSGSSSRVNVQVLSGFRIERIFGVVDIEPLLGYGWIGEKLEVNFPANSDVVEHLFRIERHGITYGSHQSLWIASHLRIHTGYTYGDYRVIDRRFRGELQYRGLLEEEEGALIIGFQGAWNGDGRSEKVLYLGFEFKHWY